MHSRKTRAFTREMVQVAGAGVILVASQQVLIALTRDITHATATSARSVAPLILGLMLSTGLALLMAARLGRFQARRGTLILIFLSGFALRAAWLGSPAPLEDDFKRYLWDGATVAHGLDPYRHAPESFDNATVPRGYEAIATAGRATLVGINFPDLRSIYPSVAQVSFALAHWIAPFSIDGLRAIFLAAEIATFFLLVVLLSDIKASALWSALYWCNPMVAFVLIGIAHVDALTSPFILGAILMLSRGRTNAALVSLGAGVGVKIWPLLLLPLALAQVPVRPAPIAVSAILLVAILALATGPVLLSTIAPHSGLVAYTWSWANNNAFFAWSAYGLTLILDDPHSAQSLLRVIAAIAAGSTAVIVAATCSSGSQHLARGSLIIVATVFYLSPAQFPWYAAWFLPLATLLRSWPLLLASATLPSYYFFFPLWANGRGDTFFFGAAFLHAVPVLGWLTVDALRSRWAG